MNFSLVLFLAYLSTTFFWSTINCQWNGGRATAQKIQSETSATAATSMEEETRVLDEVIQNALSSLHTGPLDAFLAGKDPRKVAKFNQAYARQLNSMEQQIRNFCEKQRQKLIEGDPNRNNGWKQISDCGQFAAEAIHDIDNLLRKGLPPPSQETSNGLPSGGRHRRPFFRRDVSVLKVGRSTLYGAAAGAAAGTLFLPGAGTLIGTIIGTGVGFVNGIAYQYIFD